jgi:hypothetical protein
MSRPSNAVLAERGAEIAAKLELLDEQLKVLKGERDQLAVQAKDFLVKGIPVHTDRTEFYLCPTTATVCEPAILSDTRIEPKLRQKLAKVDVTALKDLRKHGLIPDEAWNEHVQERTDEQMRSRARKPPTAQRKEQLLKSAA